MREQLLNAANAMFGRYKIRLSRVLRGDLQRRDLEAAGVRVGERVSLQPGVWVDLEWGWLIEIGDRVVLSPRVLVFAHDASMRRGLGYTKIAPVAIGNRVYVGAGSVILPGVTVGDDAIIGAGSVVSRDIPAGALAAGNPARVLCEAADYLDRRSQQIAGGLALGDLRHERDGPAWIARREELGKLVRDAGVAWV